MPKHELLGMDEKIIHHDHAAANDNGFFSRFASSCGEGRHALEFRGGAQLYGSLIPQAEAVGFQEGPSSKHGLCSLVRRLSATNVAAYASPDTNAHGFVRTLLGCA